MCKTYCILRSLVDVLSRLGRFALSGLASPVLSCALFLQINATLASGQHLTPDTCYKGPLSESPYWVGSGAPVKGFQSVWVIDSIRNEILKLDQDGWILEGFAQFERPRQIRADSDGYLLLQLVGGKPQRPQILRLDENLEVLGDPVLFDSRDDIAAGKERFYGVYDFVPLSGGVLFFGDVMTANGPVTGLFHLDGSGTLSKPLYRLPASASRDAYIKDDSLRFLATLDHTGYILLLDEPPVVARVNLQNKTIDPLESFPRDFLSYPQLDRMQEWKSAPAKGPMRRVTFFTILEHAQSVVAGLYSDDNSLYILGRKRGSSSDVADWSLVRLNKESGEEGPRLKLPTESAHLTVIPEFSGNGFWTFIEKGPVEALDVDKEIAGPFFEIDSLMLIPSIFLTGLKSATGEISIPPSDCDFLDLR